MALAIGDSIGGHRLLKLIAHGGMSSVFLATNNAGTRVAVKLLHENFATDAAYVGRVRAEARIIQALNHPHIVAVYELIDELPRALGLVMELIDGPTLKTRLKAGPIEAERALAITLQIGSALQAVHDAGVVHRDLKPDNIIFASTSEEAPIKLLDFGIAKAQSSKDQLTRAGAMLGTPSYMAPEQVLEQPVSPVTDLYALAEILFEMLSGRRLFEGDDLQVFRRKVMGERPNVTLRELGPAGVQLSRIIGGALAVNPAHRPSLETWMESLVEILGGLTGDDDLFSDKTETFGQEELGDAPQQQGTNVIEDKSSEESTRFATSIHTADDDDDEVQTLKPKPSEPPRPDFEEIPLESHPPDPEPAPPPPSKPPEAPPPTKKQEDNSELVARALVARHRSGVQVAPSVVREPEPPAVAPSAPPSPATPATDDLSPQRRAWLLVLIFSLLLTIIISLVMVWMAN